MIEQAGTGCRRQILRSKADESAGRYPVLQSHAAPSIGDRGQQLAFTLGQPAHDGALIIFLEVDSQLFPRFAAHAADLALDDLGPGDREFKALSAHGLDQHREVQLAAARDAKFIRVRRALDTQGDVVL